MGLEACREKLPMGPLWAALGLSGAEKVVSADLSRGEVKVRSPFREDNNPSFSVYLKDGRVKWKDHGTGDCGDEVTLIEFAKGVGQKEAIKIYHELAGIEMKGSGGGEKGKSKPKKKAAPAKPSAAQAALGVGADGKVVSPSGQKKKSQGGGGGNLGKMVATYQYFDADGELAHETLRFDPKAFRQRRPAREGDDPSRVRKDAQTGDEWVWSLGGAPVYPYRLPELMAWPMAEPVFLVEGEKDVENIERIGDLFATTLPMGAGKWRKDFARWFRGRWVVIVVDDDDAGREGAAKVAEALGPIVDRLGILKIKDVWSAAPAGADISDWIEWGWSIEMMVEDQREMLWAAAEKADLMNDDPYHDIADFGPRGGIALYEDRLARNLVAHEGLIYCGDSFWKWREKLGKWEKKREKTWIERKVRRALSAKDLEEAISSHRVSSVVKLARSERVCFPEDFNGYPEGLLALRNGLLDPETGRLRPHRKSHLTTVQVPHEFVLGADCPQWKRWLGGRHDDQETVDQIQEMFGYCLFPHVNYHSFFFLFGDGGTGKSTCVDVLEWLVGEENRVSLQLQDLDNAFLRSRLVGKSLYLAKELTKNSFKHIGLIKALVSGDPIDVDVKYGEGFDFRPTGRLVMESNVQAMTPDSSGGFERRFIQISFDKVIEAGDREYGFQDRFKAEMPGILNWAIEGFLRLRERGRFVHTARSQQATDDLLRHRAQVPSFLKAGWIVEESDENRDIEGSQPAWLATIHQLYFDWCDENDVDPYFKEKQKFSRELFSHRKDWRERKRRRWNNGERDYQLEGLRTIRMTDEEKSEQETNI